MQTPHPHIVVVGWAVVAALVYVMYAQVQPTYTYALLDARYDAHQYARAYAYFAGQASEWQVRFPFHTRILGPWMAAQMPFGSIEANFIWLNGIFVILTVALLVWYWQQLRFRAELIAIGLFWVLFHWKGLVRMYLPDPVTVDVTGYFFQAVWLVAVTRKWPFWVLWLTASLGALQKESFLVVVGVTALWAWWAEPQRRWFYLTLFVWLTAIYFVVNQLFPAATQDWRNNPIITVLRGLKRYATQPDLLLRLPMSWLMTFGGLWLAVIGYPFRAGGPVVIRYWLLGSSSQSESSRSFLSSRRRRNLSHLPLAAEVVFFHSFAWLLLSVLGGGDTVRILFNGLPFVLTFLLLGFEQQARWVSWYALLVSLPLMRLWALEPDLGRHPALTHHWCVECWTWQESGGYWLYALVVLSGYYYLARRLGIRPDEPHKIDPRR
ncbi:MAG: hypothetical protein MUE30_02200 [Spirosomaceae bacterium]|nr:hypothetical protein [Spirosomataceae bacterium]